MEEKEEKTFMIGLDQYSLYDDETGHINRWQLENLEILLAREVNPYSFHPEKTYADFESYMKELSQSETAANYAEGRLHRLALKWIHFFGTRPKQTPKLAYDERGIFIDERNERAVKMCRKIAATKSFQDEYDLYNVEDETGEEDIIEKAAQHFLNMVNTQMHHTLMQRATGLMIYAVRDIPDVEKMGPVWMQLR